MLWRKAGSIARGAIHISTRLSKKMHVSRGNRICLEMLATRLGWQSAARSYRYVPRRKETWGGGSHCMTTSTAPGSSVSARWNEDERGANGREIARAPAGFPSASFFLAGGARAASLLRGGSVRPRFLPRITWLRMILRSSGSGFSSPVDMTNCSSVRRPASAQGYLVKRVRTLLAHREAWWSA